MSNQGLGAALRRLRNSANMTLSDVASVAGVSVTYLSNVENGHVSPRADWVRNLVDAIGEELIDEDAA